AEHLGLAAVSLGAGAHSGAHLPVRALPGGARGPATDGSHDGDGAGAAGCARARRLACQERGDSGHVPVPPARRDDRHPARCPLLVEYRRDGAAVRRRQRLLARGSAEARGIEHYGDAVLRYGEKGFSMSDPQLTEIAGALVDYFGSQFEAERDEGRRLMAAALHERLGIPTSEATRLIEALEHAGTIRWIEPR